VPPVTAYYLGVGAEWCVEGAAADSQKKLIKLVAYACRYGHAAPWVWDVSLPILVQFCEAVNEIVQEENRPRK
jgi:hypothetical protein